MTKAAAAHYGQLFEQAGLSMPRMGEQLVLSQEPIVIQTQGVKAVMEAVNPAATHLQDIARKLTIATMQGAEGDAGVWVEPSHSNLASFIAQQTMPQHQSIGRIEDLGMRLVTPDEALAIEPGVEAIRTRAGWERLDEATLLAVFSGRLYTRGLGLTGAVGCLAASFGIRKGDAHDAARSYSHGYSTFPLRSARMLEALSHFTHVGMGRGLEARALASPISTGARGQSQQRHRSK